MCDAITSSGLLALAANPPGEPAARKALHDAARELVFATESHSDTDSRVQGSIAVLPIVKVATDLDLFNILATSNGSKTGWHVSDLASETNADPRLLHRVLRFLTSQALVAEVGEGTYTASRLTQYLQPSGFVAGVKHNSTFVAPSFAAFPAWLAKNDYRIPSSSKDSSEVAQATFVYMAWQEIRNKGGMDGSLPVVEKLCLSEQEVADGRALLVDVGGGGGHQLFEFRAAFPERKSRLILQDTEVMIGMIDKSEAKRAGIEPSAHDFFTPQPAEGAKAYYLRTVLHGWNDEKAIEILKQLSDAMTEDSLVVLDEIVLPKKGASEKLMFYDATMMAALGSAERTEEQWRAVLEAAGLKLREVAIYDEELCVGLVVATKA